MEEEEEAAEWATEVAAPAKAAAVRAKTVRVMEAAAVA